MVLKIFAVYDIKSELFGPPFFMNSTGEAVRAFKDLANDKNTTVGRHPSDFRLMQLGTFENVSGKFESQELNSLGFANDYVELRSNEVPIGIVR